MFDGKYLLVAEDGCVITNQNKPVLQLVEGQQQEPVIARPEPIDATQLAMW